MAEDNVVALHACLEICLQLPWNSIFDWLQQLPDTKQPAKGCELFSSSQDRPSSWEIHVFYNDHRKLNIRKWKVDYRGLLDRKNAHQQRVLFCMSNRCSNNRLPCVQTEAGNSYTKELSSNICKAHAWSRLFINLCDIVVIYFLVAGIVCDFQTILTRIGNEKHLVPCEHHENEPTSEQLLHQFLCLVSALDKMASFMRFTIPQSPENKNKSHQKHSMYFLTCTYHRACCQ